MKSVLKFLLLFALFLLVWQGFVMVFALPHYILPTPWQVGRSFWANFSLLLMHARITLFEIFLGLFCGFTLGLCSALLLMASKRVAAFLLPVLIASQAIPLFAIAPMLVLWFGFGVWSKVMMATLIIYFPVTAACYDGLKHTPQVWLDLAKTMNAPRVAVLLKIRLMAALPSLASGLKIAVTFAPIGAVVGEWVGSAEGLGYLMLQANARMQVDLLFAALMLLVLISLLLYFSTERLLNRLVPWQKHMN